MTPTNRLVTRSDKFTPAQSARTGREKFYTADPKFEGDTRRSPEQYRVQREETMFIEATPEEQAREIARRTDRESVLKGLDMEQVGNTLRFFAPEKQYESYVVDDRPTRYGTYTPTEAFYDPTTQELRITQYDRYKVEDVGRGDRFRATYEIAPREEAVLTRFGPIQEKIYGTGRTYYDRFDDRYNVRFQPFVKVERDYLEGIQFTYPDVWAGRSGAMAERFIEQARQDQLRQGITGFYATPVGQAFIPQTQTQELQRAQQERDRIAREQARRAQQQTGIGVMQTRTPSIRQESAGIMAQQQTQRRLGAPYQLGTPIFSTILNRQTPLPTATQLTMPAIQEESRAEEEMRARMKTNMTQLASFPFNPGKYFN